MLARSTVRPTAGGYAALIGLGRAARAGPTAGVGGGGHPLHGVGLVRALRPAGQHGRGGWPARRAAGGRAASPTRLDAVARRPRRARWPPTTLASPARDGDREALRILLVARRTCHRPHRRGQPLKALHAHRARPAARAAARPDHRAQIRRCRPLGPTARDSRRRAGPRRSCAARRQIRTLDRELPPTSANCTAWSPPSCPALLDQPGVGPISAAQLLVSWSHPGRFRSEAAFAAPRRRQPIRASSGRITRHRLNRGGDRQLNRALHTIVMTAACIHARHPRLHRPAHAPKARPTARSAAASSATSPGSSTALMQAAANPLDKP